MISRKILTLTGCVSVLLVCSIALPARAQQAAQCSSVKAVSAYLDSFGESLAFERAVDDSNMRFQFWIADDGRSWSVILISGDYACLVADGGRPARRTAL